MDEKGQAFWAFILIGASKSATFLQLLVFANLFLATELGSAALAIAWFQLGVFIVILGFPNAAVPYILKKKDFSSIFWTLLGVSVVACVAGLMMPYPSFWPLAVSYPFLFLREASHAFLRIEKKYVFVQSMLSLQAAFALLALFALFRFGAAGITLSYASGIMLTSLISSWKAREQLGRLMRMPRIAPLQQYFLLALPASFVMLSFQILGWVDSLVLGYIKGVEPVAGYTLASQVVSALSMVPVAISFLILTNAASLGREESKRQLGKALRISVLLVFLLGVALGSVARFLVVFFFPHYVGIEGYISLLVPGMVCYAGYALVYTYLSGRMEFWKAAIPLGAAALLNLGLDLLLVPPLGTYGVVIATIISHAFALVWMVQGAGEKGAVPFLVVALVSAAPFFLGLWGLLTIPAALAFLLLSGGLRRDDLLTLKSAFSAASPFRPRSGR